MQNKIIVSILTFFILVDTILIYLALTISPIKLKRNVFTFQYGQVIPTDVSEYVNANHSVLENVKLDLSHVSKEVGTYQASITYFNETQYFEIVVEDTIKPKFQLKKVEWHVQLGETLQAEDLIKNVEDHSLTKVYFYDEKSGKKSETKSFEIEGTQIERIIVEDQHGNQSSSLRVKVVVEKNAIAPTIKGIENLEIHVGESVDLYDGVYATDDIEGDITSRLIVDGHVDNQVPGIYEIMYTVSDKDGNTTQVVRTITVIEVEDDNYYLCINLCSYIYIYSVYTT